MSKLRKYAKGQPCQVMLPNVCISGGENLTTVLAHLPSFGMGTKSPDLLGAHCCSACHDVVDGRVQTDKDRDMIRNFFSEGVIRTIRKLYSDKVINE
jgi:hypothetical protein